MIDGDRVKQLRTDNALPSSTTYDYLPQGIVHATRTYSHNGDMIATRSTDEGLTWIGTTHQGTAAWAISAATMVLTYRRQDPFGKTRGETIDWTATQKGFHTGTEDPTGLVSMGARFYDPTTGRFISRDPIQHFTDSQQINGYAYANNNPIGMTDPTGLDFSCVDGDCSYHNPDGSLKNETQCRNTGCGTGQCTRGSCNSPPPPQCELYPFCEGEGPGRGFDNTPDPGCDCNISDLGSGNILIRAPEGIVLNGVDISGIGDIESLVTDILAMMDQENLTGTWGTVIAIDQICGRDIGEQYDCSWLVHNRDLVNLAYCADQGGTCDGDAWVPNDDGELIRVNYGTIHEGLLQLEAEAGIEGGDGTVPLIQWTLEWALPLGAGPACSTLVPLVCGASIFLGGGVASMYTCDPPSMSCYAQRFGIVAIGAAGGVFVGRWVDNARNGR